MQNNKSFWVLICLGIGLSSVFIRCDLSTQFVSTEQFIPKNEIKRDINALKNIRMIQFLNWPVIKKKLKKKYPMVESISLSLHQFPNVHVLIKEKMPWAIIIKENQPFIFSYDGILLNKNLSDVELPNKKIMVVNARVDLMQNDQMTTSLLSTLHRISEGLSEVPLFKVQQIIVDKNTINIIEENGLIIHVGDERNLKEKFLMLKYFLGKYRRRLNQIQLIDIQFP